MKKLFLSGGMAALFFLTACDKNNNDNNSTTLNATDQMYITQTAIGNQAEIMAGQLAATKATNAGIKAFGQMMATEHGTAQTDLKQLGTNVGMTVSDTVDAEHRDLMTR